MIRKQTGFTIIELMIATIVFSIVLLVLTGSIIQIGRIYSKGITTSKTQETARQIINDISQSIQYQSGTITDPQPSVLDPNLFGLCIGARHYVYKAGQQNTSVRHGMLATDQASGCDSSDTVGLDDPNSRTELLGDGMRLAYLNLEHDSSATQYTVTVRVVFGDDDLLCSDSFDCTSTATMSPIGSDPTMRCKNQRSGTQFCAISELKTTVERRLR